MQDTPLRRSIEREVVRWIACLWVAVAWNGVIKYHGPKPSPSANRVWVANHSSMIDYTILAAFMPFANIMQLQPGWVGFLQKHVMSCLGCVWFQRSEVRASAPCLLAAAWSAQRLRRCVQHAMRPMQPAVGCAALCAMCTSCTRCGNMAWTGARTPATASCY